jgi:hypothetical protein
MREPVVVGAFPEPFLHGFAGRTLPARVFYSLPGQRAAAEQVAEIVHGRATNLRTVFRNPRFNVLALVPGDATDRPFFVAEQRPGRGPGDYVLFRFRGNPDVLLRDPPFGRYRYHVRP